jgi:hypothetical protein
MIVGLCRNSAFAVTMIGLCRNNAFAVTMIFGHCIICGIAAVRRHNHAIKGVGPTVTTTTHALLAVPLHVGAHAGLDRWRSVMGCCLFVVLVLLKVCVVMPVWTGPTTGQQ